MKIEAIQSTKCYVGIGAEPITLTLNNISTTNKVFIIIMSGTELSTVPLWSGEYGYNDNTTIPNANGPYLTVRKLTDTTRTATFTVSCDSNSMGTFAIMLELENVCELGCSSTSLTYITSFQSLNTNIQMSITKGRPLSSEYVDSDPCELIIGAISGLDTGSVASRLPVSLTTTIPYQRLDSGSYSGTDVDGLCCWALPVKYRGDSITVKMNNYGGNETGAIGMYVAKIYVIPEIVIKSQASFGGHNPNIKLDDDTTIRIEEYSAQIKYITTSIGLPYPIWCAHSDIDITTSVPQLDGGDSYFDTTVGTPFPIFHASSNSIIPSNYTEQVDIGAFSYSGALANVTFPDMHNMYLGEFAFRHTLVYDAILYAGYVYYDTTFPDGCSIGYNDLNYNFVTSDDDIFLTNTGVPFNVIDTE